MQRFAIAIGCFVLPVFLATASAQTPASAVKPSPVPLFDADTKLEPATIEETPTALITRVADRVRDRHAREWMFHAYDHYLPLYWEHRTVSIEIVDRGAEQSERGPGKMLSADDLDHLYRYIALLGVPPRRNYADAEVVKGETLFASAGCVKCHSPTLKTSSYHPLAELRGQTIHPYTDMLLHDMGAGLADNMADGSAAAAEWRTAPLWGIGLTKGVSGGEAYLHDGRARDLSEAILWHGGEAQASREAFRTMPAADRAALIKFLQSL